MGLSGPGYPSADLSYDFFCGSICIVFGLFLVRVDLLWPCGATTTLSPTGAPPKVELLVPDLRFVAIEGVWTFFTAVVGVTVDGATVSGSSSSSIISR